MGLVVTAEVDPVTLFTTGNYPSHGGMVTTSPGFTLGMAILWYYDRLDFFSCDWGWGGSPADVTNEYVRWDPLLQNNTGSVFDSSSVPVDLRVAVGQWDRGANEQKVYTFDTSVGTGFDEISPLSPNNVLVTDVWPTVGGLQHRGALISTDAGYYDLATEGGWVIFEGWGFAFNPLVRLRHTDLVQYNDVPVLVDLATGAAALVVDDEGDPLFTAYGTQSHQFAEPSLFGQAVNFAKVQFVPDDSSTNAAPKGRVFMFASGADSPSDSTMHRYWVKVIDWNPLNVAGTPSRTHLRTRLLSAADFLKSAGGTFGGVFDSGTTTSRFMFYHPRTNRIIQYSSQVASTLGAGESKFLFVSATPNVFVLTDPSPQEEVVTGKTVSFSTDALGSLDEQIGGVSLSFTLQKVSSVDEVLTIVPSTPGQTVVVAQGVMNPTDPNLSPVIVKKNGTALTLTTHYTLNRAAGQIIFVAPEPVDGNIYTATYRHFSVPAAVPHGTLLNSQATTDVNGAAVCRVRYAEEDPVPDRWDRLDATQV